VSTKESVRIGHELKMRYVYEKEQSPFTEDEDIKLTPEYIEWLEGLVYNSIYKVDPEPKRKCDWCGKTGNVHVYHYHEECKEAILNGEGMV
jgi:hypothetical protein